MTFLFSLLKTYWPTIASIVGGMALGCFAAWQWQGLRLDALELEFGQYRNQVRQQALEARQAVIDQKEKWRKEKDDAEKTAKQREDALQSDLATAAATADRLRNTVGALRANLVTAAQPAIVETASALADVFEQCQSDYREMAEAADRHASDVKTLMDAWPK